MSFKKRPRTAHIDIRNILDNVIGLPEWDSEDYILKFKTVNNSILEIDLPLESLAKDLGYDSVSKEVILTKQDDTELRVPIDDLVDIYIGFNGTQIQTSIEAGNIIKVTLNAGSITETELEAGLLAKINSKLDANSIIDGGTF